jgi:hypothetical protein
MAKVYRAGGGTITYIDWIETSIETPAANAPGLAPTLPYWMFVNNGAATEISQYPEPIRWARSATAWPDLSPGCCDAGDIAPPSPTEPWPGDGWPVDGFYAVTVDAETAGGYDLDIHKWLSCENAPTICPYFWVGDEVVINPEEPPLRRSFPFDDTTTVVITPIFSDVAIVGDGNAFGDLNTDLRRAIAERAAGDELDWDALRDRGADPDFPFGALAWPGGTTPGPIGYRGPGGSHLTPPAAWWMTLELRDGRPFLYIHAGIVAG